MTLCLFSCWVFFLGLIGRRLPLTTLDALLLSITGTEGCDVMNFKGTNAPFRDLFLMLMLRLVLAYPVELSLAAGGMT